jgi:hypothetical protein
MDEVTRGRGKPEGARMRGWMRREGVVFGAAGLFVLATATGALAEPKKGNRALTRTGAEGPSCSLEIGES